MEVGLLGSLAGQLGDTRHRLALTLAFLHLVLDGFGHVTVDMQVVVDLLSDEVAHIFVDAHAVGSHRQ